MTGQAGQEEAESMTKGGLLSILVQKIRDIGGFDSNFDVELAAKVLLDKMMGRGFLMLEDETLIHQQQDQWGDIMVVEHGGQRVLSFDSIYEQSRMDLKRPGMLVHHYTRAMLLALAFGNPTHVTLFGLGGGCLLRATHLIDPGIRLQAVELRTAVVGIAHDYFGIPDSENIAIEVADGRHYITQQPEASTDLIFADMYHAIRADPFQMQQKFFHESRRILSADGWLVINCHELPEAGSFFLRTLKQYFKEILMCAVPGGNFVFYAGKSGMKNPKGLVPQAVECFELKTHTKLGFLLAGITPLPEGDNLWALCQRLPNSTGVFT